MARASVKSPDAFRTISEAADALDLPQHVLRFWETRFSQIKPMKRSGGRRYYRPSDIALLQGIRHLLYDEGYTIKGVQRILREQGIAHVTGMGEGLSAAEEAAAPVTARQPSGQMQQPAPATYQPVPAPQRADPVRAALHPSVSQPSAPGAPVESAPISRPTTTPQSVPAATQLSSPSLRFVQEPEPAAQPYVQPPQPQAQPVASPVDHQAVPQPQPVHNPSPSGKEPDKLCAGQTEILATALRTLMDCKAMLDQAKPAAQTNEPVSHGPKS